MIKLYKWIRNEIREYQRFCILRAWADGIISSGVLLSDKKWFCLNEKPNKQNTSP